MARRFSRPVRVRSVRRITRWLASADVISGATALAGGSAVLDQSLTAAEKLFRPFTIVRTRGTIWMSTDQVAAAENPFGALGFAVVSEAAATAGVGSIPTPISEEDSDLWYVHQFFALRILLGSGIGFATDGYARTEFDSKAMRKVNNDEDVVVVVENGSDSDGLIYLLKFRMLIKLH